MGGGGMGMGMPMGAAGAMGVAAGAYSSGIPLGEQHDILSAEDAGHPYKLDDDDGDKNWTCAEKADAADEYHCAESPTQRQRASRRCAQIERLGRACQRKQVRSARNEGARTACCGTCTCRVRSDVREVPPCTPNTQL